MSERIVSNTGPLIALAIIDQLAILQQLYQEVLVPDMVHQEVLQGGAHGLSPARHRYRWSPCERETARVDHKCARGDYRNA